MLTYEYQCKQGRYSEHSITTCINFKKWKTWYEFWNTYPAMIEMREKVAYIAESVIFDVLRKKRPKLVLIII
jgi:hypothetical protein